MGTPQSQNSSPASQFSPRDGDQPDANWALELQRPQSWRLCWHFVRKFLVFVLLVLVAVAFAGAYGVIHDQITYTVSPEYYTKFKFPQFALQESPLPDRVRAAIVGFLASWWMGLPIGILVGLMGFIHRGHRRMFEVSVRSYIFVVTFTLLVGLAGLAFGFFQTASINRAAYAGWFIPPDVVHLRRFLCVGYMHNASYLGGALSIPLAWIFHAVVRIRHGSSETSAIPLSSQ
jgi:hypothetical protein